MKITLKTEDLQNILTEKFGEDVNYELFLEDDMTYWKAKYGIKDTVLIPPKSFYFRFSPKGIKMLINASLYDPNDNPFNR